MLFYRKDILEANGLEVPKTWDEYITVAEALQGKGMQTYKYHVKK